jgi:hypothetical protein
MTVRTLKSMCFKLFGIHAREQKLCLIALDGSELDVDDDMKEIKFYEVESGCKIIVGC